VRGGDASGAVGEHALSTIMFTSGSAGTPKAVAVGLDSFVADIAGDSSSSFAISNSLTVSYIPLSHSRCVAVCVDIYIYM
jgi:long-subunit acyl-CoA synthetase (AMP-forming)